ncbi:MAG: NAD kinase [Tannerellaceae bacterium]|jgi:NAD+ kinase|nr:NAD kinase [Tannerellaceae bacterium]
MKTGVFGSEYRKDKLMLVKHLFNKLDSLKAEIYIDREFSRILNNDFGIRHITSGILDDDLRNLDIALSVGGDGAFLRTAARVNRQRIPILGINAGRLGFLADTGGSEMDDFLEEVFKNYYRVEERTLVSLNVKDTSIAGHNYALNEIAILKRDTSSMLTIHASIDNEYLATYMADGLIVATPTGSTAYSLSVNGPIIVPQSNSLLISPIAPHTLNMRPLVIPDTSVVSLTVDCRTDSFLAAIDGRSEPLPAGSVLTIAQADYKALIVKRHNHTFYDTLRRKLLWGADARFY